MFVEPPHIAANEPPCLEFLRGVILDVVYGGDHPFSFLPDLRHLFETFDLTAFFLQQLDKQLFGHILRQGDTVGIRNGITGQKSESVKRRASIG